MSFINCFIKDEYYDQKIVEEDNLKLVNNVVDWEKFRPQLEKMYSNKRGEGGRPNFDVIFMLKIQFLASIYDLSDAAAALEIRDRIRFRMFLGLPDNFPDKNTIWLFRTRMADFNLIEPIWDELMRQIEEKGYKVSKGVAVDASFIEADPGHKSADTPRGNEAKTRRSKDGTWAKKNKRSFFGYKVHTLVDNKHTIVRKIEVTTANVHDSKIDLSEEGQIVYGDKGYFGTKPKGHSAIMRRGTRGKKLDIRDELRNKRISRIRSNVEHPYAAIKTIQKSGHVRVTTVARVKVIVAMKFIGYNIMRLTSLALGKTKINKTPKHRNRPIKLPDNIPGLFQFLEL